MNLHPLLGINAVLMSCESVSGISSYKSSVPLVVVLEEVPFFCIVVREVSGAPAVCLCGLAGNAEIFEEIFAFRQFLLFQSEDGTCACKGEWES